MGESEAEADTVNEASLLVEVTETAGGVDNLVFFLKGFAGHCLIKFVEGLLDLIGIGIAVQLAIGAA